jgi:hypothetical protein
MTSTRSLTGNLCLSMIVRIIVQTKVVKMLVDINLHRFRFTSNQILLDFLKRRLLEYL